MRTQFGDRITVAVDGHVALVTLHNPPHNHVSVELLADLAEAFEAVDATAELRCSVLHAQGKNFCAGADLVNKGQPGAVGMTDAEALYEQAIRLFAVNKPIVAAIQGAAVGAGLGLALIADFRIASRDARLSANFVKLGMHPGFGLTYTLPRLIGPSKASLMFLTGRRVKADEGLGWGLVDEVVPLASLAASALRLAEEIAENAPLAILAARKTLRGDYAEAVRAHTAIELREQWRLSATQDFGEGVRATAERRPGNFAGR